MKSGHAMFLLIIVATLAHASCVSAQDTAYVDNSVLDAAFQGAQRIDLATSKAPSVVTLRDKVKIPPPKTLVLVKTFKKESLPDVLQPAFAKPGVMGVTIRGRYVAILQTEFPKEYQDVLSHELVHAYISQASPKPLPFWFQEGSAVHFSTDKGWRFYGKPSDTQTGVMEGRIVNLSDTYKQKLQSFHFLIEKAGDKRFNEWFRETVMSGNVEPRTLLGLPPKADTEARFPRRPLGLWLGAVVGVVVLIVVIAGFHTVRREGSFPN